MALDATVGGETTNSYVTLDEANAYFADRAHSSAWADELLKEAILVTASQAIDWHVTWKGTRVTGTQSMDWPRIGVLDKVGITYPSDSIPTDIKTAVFEMALVSIDSDRMADGDLDGLAEVRAASLLIKTDDGFYNTKRETIPDHIWKILSGLTTKSGIGVVRLVRA